MFDVAIEATELETFSMPTVYIAGGFDATKIVKTNNVATHIYEGEIWKIVTRDAAGDVAKVEFNLQARPTSSQSPVEDVLERTVTLYKSALAGDVDLLLHHWQLDSACKFDNRLEAIDNGITPFFRQVLDLFNGGDTARFKQARFWKEWTTRTGWRGIDLSNKVQAMRDHLDVAIKATELDAFASATVYVAGGFDANGTMRLIYVGRTANHPQRTESHYSRTLDSMPAERETTLLYAKAKACDTFFILPAVTFTGEDWLQPQATAEGLLCLLFGSCQLFNTVFAARAKAGPVDLGKEVEGGNSTLCYEAPSARRQSGSVDPTRLKLDAMLRLHSHAATFFLKLSARVASGKASNQEKVDLIFAIRTYRRVYDRLCFWRHRTLKAGTHIIKSSPKGLAIFRGIVNKQGEGGVNWLIEVTESKFPTPRDLAICVGELEAPLL
jgi:hypothetical protein